MLQEYQESPFSLWEAEDNLRTIRELMERSTRYSTFSGLSGVFAGLISIAACLAQWLWVSWLPPFVRPPAFLADWSLALGLAIGVDFLLTKRRAPIVGKRVLSRLGRQMLLAAAPGLGSGAVMTLYLLHRGMIDTIYPLWMLGYGTAVCAVGLFSQKAVSMLGCAFLGAGGATLLLQTLQPFGLSPAVLGLAMMAISAGGFHILYGISAARREAW
jgi:hypothetical protein